MARSDGAVLDWLVGTDARSVGRIRQLGKDDGSGAALELRAGAVVKLVVPTSSGRSRRICAAVAALWSSATPTLSLWPSRRRSSADAGRVVGVELLDHVVVGRPEADPAGKGWFSFGEAGLI